MRVAAGQWVTNNVELLAPIAEGAMGRVWIAYHHGLETRVAVKFVSEELAGDTPEALERFKMEARAASQIKSPHVVQTLDSGLSRFGTPYIVMELLEGESLGDRLRRHGRLGLRETGRVLSQVARALGRAHREGIVHRDIKPDNIFLTQGDEGEPFCKILDFGIAKQTRLPPMGGLTTDGKIVGTPEYMSPEQVLEDVPVDARADLWALGVVAYVCLTGELPFTGKTLGQLCLNLVSRAPAPPSTLRPGLPPAVDAWFARALSRTPSERFRSAREMANAFLAADDGSLGGLDPITAETTREGQLGAVVRGRPARRWSTPLAAAGVAGTTALLVAAVAILGSAPLQNRRRAEATLGTVASALAHETETTLVDDDVDADAPSEDEPNPEAGPDRADEERARPERPAGPTPTRDEEAERPIRRPAPPPPPPPTSKRRGKAELGF